MEEYNNNIPIGIPKLLKNIKSGCTFYYYSKNNELIGRFRKINNINNRITPNCIWLKSYWGKYRTVQEGTECVFSMDDTMHLDGPRYIIKI